MNKNILYNYFYQSLPTRPKKSSKGNIGEEIKYIFIFKNIDDSIAKNVTIKIEFSDNVKINSSFSSFNNLSINYEENYASINFESLPYNILIYISFIICVAVNDDNISISCNNNEIKLIKSSELSLKNNTEVISPLPKKFHFLITSALHEELAHFVNLNRHLKNLDNEGAIKYFSMSNAFGYVYNVILYSVNKMGMPVNGVAITKMVAQYNPDYLIFIGTCGGLRESEDLHKGDILVPDYIYDYEAGKYCDNNEHQCEKRPYDLDESIISLTSQMLIQKTDSYPFNIKTPCGLCSGSSVISSKCKRKKIAKKANRKVLGFDMESYVIPIINHFYSDLKAIVIKGIMDFGKNKNDEFKDKAKQNAVIVANDLIQYIVANKKP